MAVSVGSAGRRLAWSTTATTDVSYLTMGWYYPTSIVAQATWLSWSNTTAVLGSMTLQAAPNQSQPSLYPNVSTLSPVGSTATLDANYFPGGFVANQWYFIATLCTISSAQVWSFGMWVGTETIHPVATSTPATQSPALAPAGTLCTQGSSTGVTAQFTGDLGQFAAVLCTNDINMPLGIAAGGNLTQTERNLVYDRWVQPFWLGRPQFIRPMGAASATATCEYVSYFDQMNAGYRFQWGGNGVTSFSGTITALSSTPTQTTQPRVWDNAWCMRDRRRKR